MNEPFFSADCPDACTVESQGDASSDNAYKSNARIPTGGIGRVLVLFRITYEDCAVEPAYAATRHRSEMRLDIGYKLHVRPSQSRKPRYV